LFLYEKRMVEMAAGRPVRIVADSISTLLSTASATDILEFSGHRLRYLRSRQVLTLDVYVGGVMEERAVAGLAHLYPMILRMHYQSTGNVLQRYLQLGKLKSGQFTSQQHQFNIDSKTGIIVQPDR
ncbi:MAG TPA: ATPase, partial [Chloroflexota bacterium]|nr:ATPase [Chloroflexota bacterium]